MLPILCSPEVSQTGKPGTVSSIGARLWRPRYISVSSHCDFVSSVSSAVDALVRSQATPSPATALAARSTRLCAFALRFSPHPPPPCLDSFLVSPPLRSGSPRYTFLYPLKCLGVLRLEATSISSRVFSVSSFSFPVSHSHPATSAEML